ncbi:MAG: hypothetical protein GY701_22870 [Sulfitobacter sp.]|nr:hypothetical protein [Sulfitobacter sp.]
MSTALERDQAEIIRLLDMTEHHLTLKDCPKWVEPFRNELFIQLDHSLTLAKEAAMSTADYPMTYENQATMICRPGDSETRYTNQSVETSYRRFYRLANLNFMGIVDWFAANSWVGTVHELSTADGWRKIFNNTDGSIAFRIVQVGPMDIGTYGFHPHDLNRFFVLRGECKVKGQDQYLDECKYMQRPYDGWLQDQPSFTFFEPHSYLGPYVSVEEAQDDAKFWKLECDQELTSYELATAPEQLNMFIDRAVGAVM